MRKEMLAVRVQIPFELKSSYDSFINSQLISIIQARNITILHCYLHMGAEIDITPTIQFAIENNLKVISPKTLPQRKLENRILSSLDAIEKGVWGTRHPIGEAYDGPLDLVIVPGLAFDQEQFRLGYGGGYYDNFLIQHPEAWKLGIFYPEQKVASVPREPHDVRLNDLLVAEHH